MKLECVPPIEDLGAFVSDRFADKHDLQINVGICDVRMPSGSDVSRRETTAIERPNRRLCSLIADENIKENMLLDPKVKLVEARQDCCGHR